MRLEPEKVYPRAEFEERNWGRWGADDERGAANLLTAERVAAAARLVVRGDVFSLGLPLGPEAPVPPGRPAPEHYMTRDAGDAGGSNARAEFADDVVLLGTHTSTHIDALAHVWYGDRLYNGFPSSSVGSSGARHCGADHLGPLVSRGILFDVAGAAGVHALADGVAVTADDLRRCAERQGTALRPGDVALIRTGWWAACAAAPGQDFASEPGPDVEAACWLAEHDVAAVGADNIAFEVMPASGDRAFPVHELLLRDCGIPIIEGLTLDALARSAIHEFMFVAAPLQLVGATASPVNPLAIV